MEQTMTMTLPRWSLNDLLAEPVESSLESALAELHGKVDAFAARRGELTAAISADDFLSWLRAQEEIMVQASRVGAYVQLLFTEDTKNAVALNLRDRVDQALTEMENRLLFFSLWLKGIDDETAARITPPSGEYRYYVENIRKFKPYTLAEAEEKIVNLKDTNGIDALVNVYDMITSAFTFTVEVDGQTRTLTRDQVGALYYHPSADVRAAAFQELYRVYGEHSAVLSQIYNHRVRDWHAEALTLRSYPAPIAPRNLDNDIPDEVVDVLLEVCRRNNNVFQRYFRWKADRLGMDRLRRYDIYAPISKSDKTFEFDHAVQMTLESFGDFSPRMADLAASIMADGHIDAQNRPGKRGGAFCYAVLPGLTPWVMVNYTGLARDVATLAHELGHAVHGLMAADHSPLTFHASLPLAETASVFGEMLLTDRLLREESDPAVRRDLLSETLGSAYATVQRQAYFTIFEREAHRSIVDGRTVEQLCAQYLDNLRDQFGDSLELSDEFQWEWISIPHIYHTPFYTYAYSFGQLLVLALYQQYRREGQAFVPRFHKILAYGGSEAPATVLREAGIEIGSADFWQGGYDVLSEMIDELESL